MAQVEIRPLADSDQSFLWDALYLAIFVPPGSAPIDRSILSHAHIARYARDWGSRPGDVGFVATVDTAPIGAAWARRWADHDRGFGFVDETTPELSIAVVASHRNGGVGSALLDAMCANARRCGHDLSLSVSEGNPAARLYVRFGFEVVRQEHQSVVMRWSCCPKL